jgi:DNA mismatch repair ATPase MutS
MQRVGIAHLMMQAGLFVTADGFSADVRSRVATHFTRDEDPSVERGKLDEELDRLDGLLDDIDPSSLLLMNESFGSTNERDGAEIAICVISGLADAGVKVVYVTHLHEFAERMYGDAEPRATFLRAERDPNGVRSFRIVPAPPLPTSFGADIYRDVFGEDAATRDPTHRVAPTR